MKNYVEITCNKNFAVNLLCIFQEVLKKFVYLSNFELHLKLTTLIKTVRPLPLPSLTQTISSE